MENKGGTWRTIRGRRVFIKDGQSLTDAMRESGKFQKNRRKTLYLNKEEYGKVIHELNTYYRVFENKKLVGWRIDPFYYAFENYGFNNYNIFAKIPIVGNKDLITAIEEEFDE